MDKFYIGIQWGLRPQLFAADHEEAARPEVAGYDFVSKAFNTQAEAQEFLDGLVINR